ncbi:MAG: outer membrane lipoprotein carrier protein LolA [Alphaproteobacteria bacterium]|nr:outer membrane lipoprotein carrier protein LolA [Alphaproteobacteria bacterium]
MQFLKRLSVVLVVFVGVLGFVAQSEKAYAFVSQAEQDQIITKVENYLKQLYTMHAKFEQFSSNGSRSKGELFLKRPNRLRMEYAPPVPVLLLADGDSLIYHDKELMQTTYLDLDSNPVGILLAENPSLSSDNITITSIDRQSFVTEIGVKMKNDPGVGEFTLVFSNKPFELVQWRIVDAQGIETIVVLKDVEQGMKLTNDIFKIKEDARLNLLKRMDNR